MSQAWFAEKIANGGRATDGSIEQNGLAPADLICHKVLDLLLADVGLFSICGDRMYVLPHQMPFAMADVPMLQIYSASVEEIQAPTKRVETTFSMFVAIVYDLSSVSAAPHDSTSPRGWAPTPTTVAHMVQQVLRNNRQLTDEVNVLAPTSIVLSHNGDAGPLSLIGDEFGLDGSTRVALQVEWTWRLEVRNDDGKLETIVDAGGT